MPEVVAAQLSHRNRNLFSDHYLDHRLPQHPAWHAGAAEAMRQRGAIDAIFSAFVPSANEAQTERDLVHPILTVLGHIFEVQPTLAVPGSTAVRPDYLFYRDESDRASMKGVTLREGAIAGGMAVGDAKHWDRPLDQALSGKGDPFTNKNPGYQIAFYLQHTGLPWGILTNGRLWRLYERASAHRLDHYFEVDLVQLLETGARDPAAFQYFSHFFGATALGPGPLSLPAILQESTDYARGVSDGLKRQVYDALWSVAEGFVDYEQNELAGESAVLASVHANSLVLLYRLLFVLFAEARGLLPLRTNDAYGRRYSLDAIKKEIMREDPSTWSATQVTVWPRLRALFHAIDVGDSQLGIPSFNGGLFSPSKHPELESWAIGDAALAVAINRLARVDGEFIDYRDLASRHLGTIYEGLLEFNLRLNPGTAYNGWATELVNAKGERKASGSYYTPGFITRFMTERTLGPVVDAALAASTSGGHDAQAEAVLKLDILDPAMGSGHFLVEAVDYLAERLVAADVLPAGLRAIDGSEVATGIERSGTGRGIDELAYWRRRVAQSCIYGVDFNPLAVELAKLSIWLATAASDRPLSFLDHHLRVGNSLVGTRQADLSVAQRGRQPSRPRKAAAEKRAAEAATAGQLGWWEGEGFRRTVSVAVDSMWLIEENAADTLDDIRTQERLYRDLRAGLNREYGSVADLVTATRFGLPPVDAALWQPLVDFAAGRALAAPPAFQTQLDRAAELADQYRFFHWELEFPEVFFDRTGQPLDDAGFAAVLGNPPYIRQEGLGDYKPYLKAAFPETYHGVADIYVYFYQRGLELLQPGGRMAYIVTNKWLRAGYGQPLRAYFARKDAVEELIDFGHAPVFEDADVFPCILVLSRAEEDAPPTMSDGATVLVAEFPREQLHKVDVGEYVAGHGHRVPRRRFGRDGEPWSLEPQEVVDLMAKIQRAGVPLEEFAGVKPYYGIKTGFNEAFLIDTPTRDRLVREDPRSADIIKPYLRGQDIKRWVPEWAGLWMIALASSDNRDWPWSRHAEIDEARSVFAAFMPAIHGHLSAFADRLAVRQDKGKFWWELRSCTYYAVFEEPKLVIQRITFHPRLAADTARFFLNDSCIILPGIDEWALACMNSPALWYFMFRSLAHKKDEALAMDIVNVNHLPIAQPSPAIREAIDSAVQRLMVITGANQESRAATLDWLRTQFDIDKPGQKLTNFAALTSDAFVAEVRARRGRSSAPLSPAALKALRDGYADQATPVRERSAEANALERMIARRVNEAYGLTAVDVDLMWRTAPPRMPVGRED